MCHRVALAVVISVALLVLGGCGGDDGEGALERRTLIGPNGGTIVSADRNATVVVPAEAISLAQQFTSERIVGPPTDPGLVANTAYRFGPEGWVFEAPVTITIGYSEAALPDGVAEGTLQIARLGSDGWAPVGTSVVDEAANRVTAEIVGFSAFAIVGQPAEGEE
ncbi:MAG: hypothetical protein ACOX9R_12625 [Armatimonadota bacterium]|jgi:hypothetical protein